MYKNALWALVLLMAAQVAILLFALRQFGWDAQGMARFKNSPIGKLWRFLQVLTVLIAGVAIVSLWIGRGA